MAGGIASKRQMPHGHAVNAPTALVTPTSVMKARVPDDEEAGDVLEGGEVLLRCGHERVAAFERRGVARRPHASSKPISSATM